MQNNTGEVFRLGGVGWGPIYLKVNCHTGGQRVNTMGEFGAEDVRKQSQARLLGYQESVRLLHFSGFTLTHAKMGGR